MAWVFDGVYVGSFLTAVFSIAVLAVLNALVWPLVIRFTLPLVLLTAGLFTFVLNAAFILIVSKLVDGLEVDSFGLALLVSVVLTAANLVAGSVLHIDDDHLWRQIVVRRIVRRTEPTEPTDVPGLLFVQIDGLGHDVLVDAMHSGNAPMLARFVEAGTHHLIRWECDLSSQTGAMQAGILLGDNHNMPAFRWYEKETGRIMVSNRPRDAAEIEERQSTGTGLLVGGGASRANVFTGDTDDAMFTFSSVLDKPLRRQRFLYVVSTPFALIRIILLAIGDIFRERRAARRARRAGVQPQMHRGGVYPLLRAATTVVLAELTYAMLLSDIERGVPSAYVDLVGYDEVAHHSGIAAAESIEMLRRIDDQLERLLMTLENAHRPYFVVVLADHGQTQGATFEQRYGQSLGDVVRGLADGKGVAAPILAEEGWNNVNGLLTDAAADDSTLGKMVKRTTRRRSKDGEVVLGPDTERSRSMDSDDIVVLASGNLGLLSFPEIAGRATRQQLDAHYPGLVDGLRAHQGIGVILVRDEEAGDLVLGPDGIRHLRDDRVDGVDPLAHFGPNAADHLRRTSSFDNCPDLLVNSFYDPVADEGAAFEELIGFHGGLGGKQCHPFVLAPAELTQPSAPLIGARSIHDLFKTWIAEAQPAETPHSEI